MTTDLTLAYSSAVAVTHVEGNTDAGVEFVDAFNGIDVVVLDSGRIMVPTSSAEAIAELAQQAGLTVEREGAT